MYNYISGKIVIQENNYVVVDNSKIGYTIYVANPFSYQLNEETTIFVYNHIRDDEHALYGFKTQEERNLFLKLIEVKGLGPKMVMPLLATGNINDIINAINEENISYLKKFPKIGEKLAKQIILDLKGKLIANDKLVNKSFEELKNVLESLGYKNNEINKILPKIDTNLDIEKQIKEALKLMLR